MSITKHLNRVTIIQKDYLKDKPPAPRSVKIELVSRCNYKCKYCAFTFRKTQPNQDMDFELFKRITREMRDAGVEEFGLFLIGESFLNANLLVKAIRYLKQSLQAPYVFVTANGSVANPRAVEECMKVGLDSLKWSCNAADEQQFEELMGVSPMLLNLAKENIKAAWNIRNKGKYACNLSASSVKYNEVQIKKMRPLLNEYILPYVDEFYWLPLYTVGGVAGSTERELGMVPTAGNTGRIDNPSDPIPCWVLFSAAHIMYDGSMTACCLDSRGDWIMGDLKKQSFMDIWNSDEFVKLRQAHLSKNIIGTKCEKCALYKED